MKMRNQIVPWLPDVEETTTPVFLPQLNAQPDPIAVIACERPDLATDLVRRLVDLEERKLNVQRHREVITGTVETSRNQAAIIIAAVQSRPDRDHFRASTTARSCVEGFWRDSDVRAFTVTTQLDMW